jgi:protein phosphatase PTC7
MLATVSRFVRTLKLVSAARMIPHPEKAATGGEDFFFIAPDDRTVGVADGVGGWAGVPGADPAKYSRDIMNYSKDLCHLSDPRTILTEAYGKLDLRIPGSTTALVAQVKPNGLHVCNVGDSALSVLRGYRSIFQTKDTVFGFNFPYQLGSRGQVLPIHGSYDVVEIRIGDVLLLGTDGLWDNVWMGKIEEEIAAAGRAGVDAAALAKRIAANLSELAHANGKDRTFFSPFAQEAARAGFRHLGGKLDDVTVLASIVVADHE